MTAQKTTDESAKPRSRSRKAETPQPEPLLQDRRFVLALVVLAVVVLFGAGYMVGHAAGEDAVRGPAAPVPGRDEGAPAGGFIGVVGRGVEGGALLLEVVPGSPADEAGLRRRDVVVAFDGIDVTSMESLARLVRGTEPGTTIELTVRRGDRTRTFEVDVITRPDAVDRLGRARPRPPG